MPFDFAGFSPHQRHLLERLEQGWVAELRKPRVRGGVSRYYILRSPGTDEASGRFIQSVTIDRLIKAEAAVSLRIPRLDVTWVVGIGYYRDRAAAFDLLTLEHPPRTTNHPPPRFRDRQ